MKWFPWQRIVRHVARSHGFLDPFALLARLQQFGQPSEVHHPIELLRAGVAMHARGLLNARIIQHNLDWVWPYWVQRQFDPRDVAFIPRAFSLTHINLTHRNWTAVGLPNLAEMPIVDPAGLVTPCWDGWSLDAWVGAKDGEWLLPARSGGVTQTIDIEQGLALRTHARTEQLSLHARVEVVETETAYICRVRYEACATQGGWLVVTLRPFNPEGVAFIHDVRLSEAGDRWTVNDTQTVELSDAPDDHHVSQYHAGDVFLHLHESSNARVVHCDLGMATAAARYRLEAGIPRTVECRIPLQSRATRPFAPMSWADSLTGACRLAVPDRRYQALFDIALRTLVLLSPDDVYPGPYTYKRFWFRDAAFLIDGLLAMGFTARAQQALSRYAARQNVRGYFHSQDGEWDSNGEALWILLRYCERTGHRPDAEWLKMARRGADWILRKRLPETPDSPHAGLLPPGFSAEHLGPNDYYYWDDFWGVAGLRAAAALLRRGGEDEAAAKYAQAAEAFLACIERSLARCQQRLGRAAMPAAPYRRLDAGAIGSIVAGYPLQIYAPEDRRLLDSAEYLMSQCRVGDGFFQDMIHSGINAYLTLHIAQVLMRAGDTRYIELMDAVVDLASPTGQWPEAIHPQTRGGCMGDGQHGWAAAEWLIMLRNAFVREEDDGLVLAAGIPAAWLETGGEISLGPTPTRYGPVSVSVAGDPERPHVRWQGIWRNGAPRVRIAMLGYEAAPAAGENEVTLRRR